MRYALIGCGNISKRHIEAALAAHLDIVPLFDTVLANVEKALESTPEDRRYGSQWGSEKYMNIKHMDTVGQTLVLIAG